MSKKFGICLKTCSIYATLMVLFLVFFGGAMDQASGSSPASFPTPQKPLLIDKKERQVLLYTEINLKYLTETNPHWGIVSRQGKLDDKAIFKADTSPSDFYDALVGIGAHPGNNLKLASRGERVKGDRLVISATWPGLNKELSIHSIISDSAGRGFDIRFGGNRKTAVEASTGCLLCLESCPISITSNAAYPTIGPVKRLFSPNSHFKGRQDTLPHVSRHPVIFIFRLAVSTPE